ncbi:MAG: hypothetical protein P8X96_23460 [Desulfobacteraceae bacterium]
MSTTGAQSSAQVQAANQLNSQDLVAGDIIATRSDTTTSTVVRAATFGKVSHAILYTGGKMGAQNAVDATGKGVTGERLYRKLQHVSYAAVFRHKTATPAQCARACQWAELQAQLHKPYDYKSAARMGKATKYTRVGQLIIILDDAEAALNPEGEDASFACSELVFRAWEIAGAPLIDKPAHLLAPNMLFKTRRLAMLGRIV